MIEGDAFSDAPLMPIRDTSVRWRLLDLIEQATADLKDETFHVVVLAARRMSCLYSLLRLDGLPAPANGLVLGDRFLEMSPEQEDWNGKKVLVLDDSRVSGKTLSDRVVRLEKMVGSDGSVKADVVVATSASDVGVPLRSEPIVLDKYEMAHLNRDYARVFSKALMPYFTDFAISSAELITVEALETLLENGPWTSVDVTNVAAAGSSHRTYSLLPNDEVIHDFEARFNPTPGVIEVYKIRLFTADAGTSVRVRAVPIVSFAPLNTDSVHEAVSSSRSIGDDLSAVQLIRILTLVLSQELLDSFSRTCESLIDVSFVRDDVISEVNGGPRLDDYTAAILGNLRVIQRLRPAREPAKEGTEGVQRIRWQRHKLDDRPWFLVLGDNLVDPVFKRLIELGNKYKDDDPVDTDSYWAANSVALQHEAVQLGSNSATLSLAVDVLNDLGIAVPQYYSHGGALFRGYRPGETALADSFSSPGRLGGRLASLPETVAVADQFGADEPRLLLELLQAERPEAGSS